MRPLFHFEGVAKMADHTFRLRSLSYRGQDRLIRRTSYQAGANRLTLMLRLRICARA
jgi:hypothetical protein